MKIELIRLKFNNTYSYKYKPFKYCCDKFQNDKAIIFTNEDFVCDNIFGELIIRDLDDIIVPQFCNSEIVDSWGDVNNYPIQFCPHCGERINTYVINEIDVSNKYNKLSKQSDELRKKYQKTDSIKKGNELREQIRKIDKLISNFYKLDEGKEDLYVRVLLKYIEDKYKSKYKGEYNYDIKRCSRNDEQQ